MKSAFGVALIFVLAVAPLVLPLAALSPNVFFVRQVTLRLSYDGVGVTGELEAVKLWGAGKTVRYRHVESAVNEFVPVANADDVVSTLALRTEGGVYYPFDGIRGSRVPRSMKVESLDVIRLSADINGFIEHPLSAPLVLVRSQSYPLGFVVFDAIGLILGLVIAWFWTGPLGLAAWRKIRGAPSKDVAAPFIGILGRAEQLAMWAKSRG